jgi:hypothetical protein
LIFPIAEQLVCQQAYLRLFGCRTVGHGCLKKQCFQCVKSLVVTVFLNVSALSRAGEGLDGVDSWNPLSAAKSNLSEVAIFLQR